MYTVYIYMYTCIHVYMYTCIHVYMYTCIHVYMYYIYMCVYIFTRKFGPFLTDGDLEYLGGLPKLYYSSIQPELTKTQGLNPVWPEVLTLKPK